MRLLLPILLAACAPKPTAPEAAADLPPAIALEADDAVWKEGGETGALVVPMKVTNTTTRGVDVDLVSVTIGDCRGETTVAERLLPGKTTHLLVTIPCDRAQLGDQVELSAVAVYETNDQKRTASVTPTVRVSH